MRPERARTLSVAGLVFAAGVLSAACASAGPSDPGDVPQAFETLLSETRSGIGEKRREVVRDQPGWARLWEEIHSLASPRPPLPPVDFARQMLVVAATGTRPSGGYGIRIQAVATRGDRLEVSVLETCPAPGAVVTMELTQPVAVARVPRLPHAATFRESRAASCR